MENLPDNKFLTLYKAPGALESTVVLTPIITPVIVGMEKFFKEAGHHAFVTSGLRDSIAQLRIIRNELIRRKLEIEFADAVNCGPNDKNPDGTFKWQLGWSKLLNSNFIVNPPQDAVVLMDYLGPTGQGPNRKGTVIHQSPHTRGTAFDIGGDTDGIGNEVICVVKAHQSNLPGFISFLIERNNNCVHCDCQKIL